MVLITMIIKMLNCENIFQSMFQWRPRIYFKCAMVTWFL